MALPDLLVINQSVGAGRWALSLVGWVDMASPTYRPRCEGCAPSAERKGGIPAAHEESGETRNPDKVSRDSVFPDTRRRAACSSDHLPRIAVREEDGGPCCCWPASLSS